MHRKRRALVGLAGAAVAVLAVVVLADRATRSFTSSTDTRAESDRSAQSLGSRAGDQASDRDARLGTSIAGPGGWLDGGGRLTPQLLGLRPVAIPPDSVHVPRETRLREATDAVARFADRLERLEDERRQQLLAGNFDTDRIDTAIAAARHQLTIAEFAERAIQEEPASVSP